MKEYYKDYQKNNGIAPLDRVVKWETKQHLKNRIQKVINKYRNYECVIFVFHQLAIQAVTEKEKIEPGEIIEFMV